MTLRRRLMLASMTTLAVGLGALLITGNVLFAHRVSTEITSVLRADADSQISALRVTADDVSVRQTANDAALDQRGWVFSGSRVIEQPPSASPALNRLAISLGQDGREQEVDGPDDTRLSVQPIRAAGTDRVVGSVVVVYATESLEQLQQAVLAGSLVIAALVMIAGWLAIRSAVTGALEPVAQMTDAARTWSASDLERRFDLGPARDELTGLAATLDGLLGRIAASRRHEQRLAGEIAHELRTPLAGLRARAELALRAEGESAADERRAALEAVVIDSDRLAAAIDTLLAIARQELDPSEGSVDLAGIAAEIEDIEISPSPIVLPKAEGDPDVVRRAIAPLVDNAKRHSRDRVWIELTATDHTVRLAVCDDGPGIAADLAEQVFDPGFRGSDQDPGAGLGLSLARRLARSCGGDVKVEPGDGGRFVLELPAFGPTT